ncbi:hypothetical protein U1Q18_024770 [Sarracenia purpurea var. burkii]
MNLSTVRMLPSRMPTLQSCGISIYNVVLQSLCDEKSLRDEKTEHYKEVIETLQAMIGRLEKESSCGCKILHNQAEMLLSCDAKLDSQIAQCLDSNGNQKSEEVLRIFMMKEFVGGHIFDDLLKEWYESAQAPSGEEAFKDAISGGRRSRFFEQDEIRRRRFQQRAARGAVTGD